MAGTTQLADTQFIGKSGSIIKVKDLITSDDCWATKEGNLILSHKAVQKIAAAGGISKTYDVHESEIHPDFKNGLEHIVRVTIKCKSMPAEGKTGCAHDDEATLTVTGEANRENTSNRGKGYLRKMAEKRAYDIAVLEHLGLYTTLFSEEEAESFSKEPIVQEQSIQLLNTDLEVTRAEVNALLKSKDDDELAAAWKAVDAKHKVTPFTRNQLTFLADMYDKQVILINKAKK